MKRTERTSALSMARPTWVRPTDFGGMIENDLAGGRDDESDLVEGGGKGHREVATIMHAAETDPVVPAVDTADDDVFW